MHRRIANAAGFAATTMGTLCLYLVIRNSSSMDMKMQGPMEHFYIVSAVALIALAVAVVVGISGNRLRNIGVTFLSLAFISLAEVFTAHGLSTPGFLLGDNHLAGVESELSVTLTAFWILMSSLSSDFPVVRALARCQRWLVPTWVLVLGVIGAYSLLDPSSANWIPLDKKPLNYCFAGVTTVLCLFAAWRYLRSYSYSRFPLQISIVHSCGLLITAQIIIITGEKWMMSWWLYHFLLLAAMIVIVIGLMRQYATGASIGLAVRGLFSTDPVERIEAGISSSVRALILATEEKDAYTAGHNFRVALYALRLAEEMNVPPEKLRAVAQGTIIHDVGKIDVPDEILNKPGKLEPEERIIIERHPVTGYELCKRFGFLQDELDIIRHHHERYDGTGYPDRLSGQDIPMLARIAAVADVYDALTSARSYRVAWSHEQAMQLVREEAGRQFDPDCVEAWIRLHNKGVTIKDCPAWMSGMAAPQPT